jgi:hypothetical protein
MELHFGKGLGKVQRSFEKILARTPNIRNSFGGLEIQVGLADDPKFQTPAHAQDAVFVGDRRHIIGKVCDAATEALLRTNPKEVVVIPRYNPARWGWDICFKRKHGEGAADALPNLIAGQLFAPWTVSYFTQVFRRPLEYTNIDAFLRREAGTNPWAVVMDLFDQDYIGAAVLNETGDLQNQYSEDVNVIHRPMAAKVINLSVSYTLTVEELEIDKYRTGSPVQGQGLTYKPYYARYALDMLSAALKCFGNAETGTNGLLTVSPIIIHSGATIKATATGAGSSTRGSDIYKLLANEVNAFLSEADNKYDVVKIGMSPETYNYFTSTPYSDAYNPTSAAKIFAENYLAGRGPDGTTPAVQFVSEPLFKANSVYNPEPEDYLVIAAPEIGAGPLDEKQPLLLSGEPLNEFVFPAIPGTYNTQYKMLRRLAGVFAPVPKAVRVYKGLGVAG